MCINHYIITDLHYQRAAHPRLLQTLHSQADTEGEKNTFFC